MNNLVLKKLFQIETRLQIMFSSVKPLVKRRIWRCSFSSN